MGPKNMFKKQGKEVVMCFSGGKETRHWLHLTASEVVLKTVKEGHLEQPKLA